MRSPLFALCVAVATCCQTHATTDLPSANGTINVCLDTPQGVLPPRADITEALDWAIAEATRARKAVFIDTAPTDANIADQCWGITSTIRIPAGINLKIRGVGGAAVMNHAKDQGVLGNGKVLALAYLVRVDNDDLAWPLFETQASRLKLSGLYLRGAFDASTAPRPAVGIVQTKGEGVGTGWSTFQDLTLDYFDCGISIGGEGPASNCEYNTFKNIVFKRCGVGIRVQHSQAHSHTIDTCYGDAPVMYQVVSGGPLLIRRQLITQSNQVCLKIDGDNKNTGLFRIVDSKMDMQATGAVLVEVDAVGRDRNNHLLIDGLIDSRVCSGMDERIARLHGNCHLTIRGSTGIGKIIVSGERVNTRSGSRNRLSAPTILLDGCELTTKESIRDPRSLLVKPDGSPADQGVDYAGFRAVNCVAGEVIGSPNDNIPFNRFLPDIVDP